MTMTEVARQVRAFEDEAPRCECTHRGGTVRSPGEAEYAVTAVCAAEGCDCAAGVYLLCAECLAVWRRRSGEPGWPELRVHRL